MNLQFEDRSVCRNGTKVLIALEQRLPDGWVEAYFAIHIMYLEVWGDFARSLRFISCTYRTRNGWRKGWCGRGQGHAG